MQVKPGIGKIQDGMQVIRHDDKDRYILILLFQVVNPFIYKTIAAGNVNLGYPSEVCEDDKIHRAAIVMLPPGYHTY